MSTRWILAGSLIASMALAQGIRAQDKPKPPEGQKAEVAIRLQVVFSEYEGDKKISSLPYILSTHANERSDCSLRTGMRIPIMVGAKESTAQYIDVGTNIDCFAKALDDGRFDVRLTVERFSVVGGSETKSQDTADRSGQPMLRSFRAVAGTIVREGQTVQSTLATDPVSGRVVKVDVTLNVPK